jgi:hypothetical protein
MVRCSGCHQKAKYALAERYVSDLAVLGVPICSVCTLRHESAAGGVCGLCERELKRAVA